jgi:uncharacterized protein (TIGR02145 family)
MFGFTMENGTWRMENNSQFSILNSQLVLAMILAVLVACSEHERDNILDPHNGGGISQSGGGSSSSGDGSSSGGSSGGGSSSGSSSSATSSSSKACPTNLQSWEFCYGGEVYDKCSGEYNPTITGCCNSVQYTLSSQFCDNTNKILDKCKGEEYNPGAQFCGGESYGVLDKCQKNMTTDNVPDKTTPAEYDPDLVGCCNSKQFWLSSHFCGGESGILARCDGEEYNPIAQGCCENKIFDRSTQMCHNNKTKLYFTDTRGGGKIYPYVHIKDRYWMAENLNFDTGDEGSVCYEGSDYNCQRCGRLYNWETATGGKSSTEKPSGVQGVCPDGWHIPSDKEWYELAHEVHNIPIIINQNTYNGPYDSKVLRAESFCIGSNCGDDEYGFSAIGCGSGIDGTDGVKFGGMGNTALWGYATAYSGVYNSSTRGTDGYIEYAGQSLSKSSYFSVRCAKE